MGSLTKRNQDRVSLNVLFTHSGSFIFAVELLPLLGEFSLFESIMKSHLS